MRPIRKRAACNVAFFSMACVDAYPLNDVHYGTERRLVQPRFHKQPPHALQLEVCEEGTPQHLMVYQAMQKPVPVKIEWPRIDSLKLKNAGYLPIKIRDLHVVEMPGGAPVIALESAYLSENTLPPGQHHVRRIDCLIKAKGALLPCACMRRGRI